MDDRQGARGEELGLAASMADEALDRYEEALGGLSGARPAAGDLLRALIQRDRVARVLVGAGRTAERIQRLVTLDRGLRSAAQLCSGLDWSGWRQAADVPVESWWWRLDEAQASEAERRDLVWVMVAGIVMTATLGLGTDISLRLWGSGAGSLSVVSAILTVVLTGGPLTTRGQELARWLLKQLRLPMRYRGSTTAAAALLFFLLTLILRLVALPAWARLYNNRAVNLLIAGELTAAESALDRAVSIDPEYAAAYYNLASAYLDIGDYDRAGTLFSQALAADRGLDLAYSGLGYVLTLQGQSERAIPLLYAGLARAQDGEARTALLTNLGRAYRGSGRLLEAEAALEQALASDPHDASAHCLLALVGEELEHDLDEVRVEWEQCLSYANQTTPRGQEQAAQARAHLRLLEGGE